MLIFVKCSVKLFCVVLHIYSELQSLSSGNMTIGSDVAKFSYSFAFTKATETDDLWVVEGIASTDEIDREADIITKEAVEKGMDEYMSNAIVLWMHDHDDPVGKVVSWSYIKAGLLIRVEITKTEKMVDRWKLIKDGVVKAFSISGTVMKSVEVKGEEDQLIRKATEIDIWEISIVSVPANKTCLFNVISKAAKEPVNKEEGVKKLTDKNKPEKDEKEVQVVKVTDLNEIKKTITDLTEEMVKQKELENEKDSEPEEEPEEEKKPESESEKISKEALRDLVKSELENQAMRKALLEIPPEDLTPKSKPLESILVKGLFKNSGLDYKSRGGMK